MLKIIVATVVIFVNFILETTLLQNISIAGIMPNITITIVISVALLRGSYAAAVFGFFAGLLPDIFFGDMIGFHSLIYVLVAYISGLFHKDFYKENYVLPFLLTLFFSFAYGEIIFISQFLLSSTGPDFIYYLFKIVIPEIVYTTFLSFIVYRLVYAIDSFVRDREPKALWY